MTGCCSEFKDNQFYEHLKSLTGSADRFPLKCQWEITCRCNFKCVMCYTDCFNTAEDIARELSTAEILKIMDEMRDAGVMELTLTGGEPMSRPDFRGIYTHAVKSGFLTEIYTNGAYINESWIELWKELPPYGIEISFHGNTPETFDQVTAMKGSYERVMRGIQLAVENNLPLTLKTTGLPLNYDEILKIKSWARSLSNVQFRFGSRIRSLANGDTAPQRFQLEEEKLSALFARDEEFQKSAKNLEAQENAPVSCNDARKQFHIDAYGNLQLCSGNRLQSYSLKTGSFKEGYYQALPQFPCPRKKNCAPAVNHAS